MEWKILDTGRNSAEKNMAIDYALLRDLRNTAQPILHLYEWDGPSATYGHFLDPYRYLNRDAVEKHGLQLARRPTGGGIVFHLTDMAYSILIPASHPGYSVNTLDNYAFVNRLVAEAVRSALESDSAAELLQSEPCPSHPHEAHFCMAKPTRYDVMWKGKKVGGGAQRRTKHGFLHQGTLSIGEPDSELIRELLVEEGVADAMLKNGHYMLGSQHKREELEVLRRRFREAMESLFAFNCIPS